MPERPQFLTTDAKSDRQKEADNDLVLSYLTLRNLIGICGMLLPLVLIVFTTRSGTDARIEPSLSDYYYTSSGEIFVVVLSTLAVFLFTYRGYRGDKFWTFLAGICAMGVAFFPTASACHRIAFSVHTPRCTVPRFFDLIEYHFLFAASFFISVAILSLVYFTKTSTHLTSEATLKADGTKTQKGKRNVVYKVCGWTIIGCIVLLGIYFRSPALREWLGGFPTIFVLETIAVEAFGFSWLTKGETLWPDGKSYFIRLFRMLSQPR